MGLWDIDPETGKWGYVDDPPEGTGTQPSDPPSGVFRVIHGYLQLINPKTGATIKNYGRVAEPESDGFETVMNGRRVLLDRVTGRQIIDLGPEKLGLDEAERIKISKAGLGLEQGRLDLAKLEFDASEAARAEEARFRQQQLGQSASQFGQTFGLQQEQFAEQIRANIAQETAARENLRFLREKFAVEENADNKRIALQTAQLIDQVQGRLDNLAFQRTMLQSEAQKVQAQFQFQAEQENQRAQQEADQVNEQRRQANLALRRSVAGDIAELSKDPGSRAALASFLGTMTGQASPFSTALAQGQDFRTDESMFPLMMMLAEQQELAKGPQFFNPQLIQAPRVPVPQFAPIQAPNFSQLFNTARLAQGLPQPSTQAQGLPQPSTQAQAKPLSAQDAISAGIVPTAENPGFENVTWTPEEYARFFRAAHPGAPEWVKQKLDEEARQPVPAKAKGGKSMGPVTVVGEKGPEVVIDLPDGIFVINEKQLGFDPKKLAANNAAAGGFFSSMGARDFLNQAVMRAAAGTPFAGQIPTPVGVSAPGTPQFFQQFAAGLAATGRGVPQPLFFEESSRVAPAGVPQSIMRRTA